MTLWAIGDLEPAIDPTAYVHPDATLIGAVRLGPHSSVWPGAVLRADFNEVIVGARSSVQDGTIIHTVYDTPTVVGDDCIVGHSAHLEGCTVGDRCIIGSLAGILPGARVHNDSMVGAGALVTEGFEVPSGHLAVGVPARSRPAGDFRSKVLTGAQEYSRMADDYRSGLRRLD